MYIIAGVILYMSGKRSFQSSLMWNFSQKRSLGSKPTSGKFCINFRTILFIGIRRFVQDHRKMCTCTFEDLQHKKITFRTCDLQLSSKNTCRTRTSAEQEYMYNIRTCRARIPQNMRTCRTIIPVEHAVLQNMNTYRSCDPVEQEYLQNMRSCRT